MKDNFSEVFEEMYQQCKQGIIDVELLLDAIIPRMLFYSPITKEDLLRKWLKARLEVSLNANDCYSVAKGQFIWIENADLKQLLQMDDNLRQSIAGRENTLKKIREREADKGQFKWVFRDGEFAVEEEIGIDEILAQ